MLEVWEAITSIPFTVDFIFDIKCSKKVKQKIQNKQNIFVCPQIWNWKKKVLKIQSHEIVADLHVTAIACPKLRWSRTLQDRHMNKRHQSATAKITHTVVEFNFLFSCWG
jgi:hypothetical protein